MKEMILVNNNTVIQQQQVSKIDRLKVHFTELVNQREKTYVEIGKTLNLLQKEFKEEGKFMEWLKTETRITYSTANRYMKVANEFQGNYNWAEILGVKKAYLLTKIENKEERLEFMKKHQVSKKSYDEIKRLLTDYLNKEKKENSTQQAINPKRAINKLKKTIEKEVDNYNFIINELGDEARIGILDIKDKLRELQTLLTNLSDTNTKIVIDDIETETPITILDDKDDSSIIFSFDDPNEYNY